MKIKRERAILLVILLIVGSVNLCAQQKDVKQHPLLSLTQESVKNIRMDMTRFPILDSSFQKMKNEADKFIKDGIHVPIPVDPAGGYTHNQHKANYMGMYNAGIIYQLTGEQKFAVFIRDMLYAYAKLYPTLGLHPTRRPNSRGGKLYWQSLNDGVWMVYTVQAYDCIYDFLSKSERSLIENDLLFPFADWLSVESVKGFNRIHNDGVWKCAAVGMCGLTTGKNELLERALYGVQNEEERIPGGFLDELDKLFSPEGYYTEGPYYQRYALLPFMVFSQALNNAKPELKIFEYRDNILEKAVNTQLQLTNTDGTFFPFNDATKVMSYLGPELINAVDIVYANGSNNPQLLDIAEKQNEVILSASGYEVAKAISNGKTKKFLRKSMELGDGGDGQKGAVGILRSETSALVMLYPTQGMGHGHYDRLSCIYFNQGIEILRDYGAARFVNFVQKDGGKYLPENETWAKQTIAHNTVCVNEKTQFDKNYDKAQKFNAEKFYFNIDNADFQVVSGIDKHAVDGVEMQRTMILLNDKDYFEDAILIDIFNLRSDKKNQYDLPWNYNGQFIYTNAEYKYNNNELHTLGNSNGYQHLWLEGQGKAKDGLQFTFLKNNKFYSIHSATDQNSEILFTRIGANDPDFNLRHEPSMIIRQKDVSDYTYVSLLEPHGSADPNLELIKSPYGMIKSILNISNDVRYTVVKIITKNNHELQIAISNLDNKASSVHKIDVNGEILTWKGFIKVFKN